MQYILKSAILSHCKRYRYMLFRTWHNPAVPPDTFRSCTFVMLNPSTADGETDDQTIRKCVGFAHAWGFNRLEVVNLFAWRATQPLPELKTAQDPIGQFNDQYIEAAAHGSKRIVCAWGNHGNLYGRDLAVRKLLNRHPLYCFALNDRSQQPKHPLYVSGLTEPFVFQESAR